MRLAIIFGSKLQKEEKFKAIFSLVDMAIRKNNHPAFPVAHFGGDAKTGSVKPNSGMGIRDYFAASSLRGYRSCEEFSGVDSEMVAELSFADADAMLLEREKNNQ